MLSFVWLCMCVRGPRGQLMKAEGTPLRPWGLSIALLLGMRLVPPANLYASWRSGRVFHFFNSLPIILPVSGPVLGTWEAHSKCL